MMSVSLYHNPRCSKSRATLALLEANGVAPEIRLYLEQAPSIQELVELMSMLGMDDARSLMRKGEEAYKLEQLADTELTQSELIAAMAKHPKLIERPIVIHQGHARIGRPPESVLEIL
ncbi:MAG: arsenate reductase (glutaredoxin) [Gammaproteobacteria bacterium]|nr:arsenate reductase (glutaredoxin) [Gammaproteobacteria bacterium]